VEELARERVPERRIAGLVHHPAELGQGTIAEALAMELHEQVAAPSEQPAPATGADLRVEEQPADFGAAFKIGGQAQHLVAEGLAEFRAALGEGAEMVTVEGLADADLPEHLAGAADLLRFRVFENEDIEIAGLHVAF